MKTPEEYKNSLRKMRANIYKFGELIEDVTTHPATKRTIEGHAKIFEASQQKEYKDILTTKSILTGKQISRYLSVIKNADDMIMNVKMKRLMFQLTGTCTGGRCVGFNALNAMWSTTYDIDKEYHTDYHERLKIWLKKAQEDDIAVAGALTDPKGDRTKTPSQQKNPDLYLHVVEEQEDGITVRGAKIMIAGVAASNEIFIMPGSRYKEEDKDYAISFAIPRDIKGLTIIETRHPSDLREYEEGFDIPVEHGGITQAYLLFNDVFIPKNRIFMYREYKYTMEAVLNFVAPYRAAIGGCVAGQGDVMIGASILISRANGLNEKIFREKIIQMIINNETTFGIGVAAAALGSRHPSGVWLPNTLLSNVNKVHVGTLPYDTKRIVQDIAGGIGETGCIPSYKDLMNPEYGETLLKYLQANSSGETRAKIARLIEWLTLGAGVPGCMHGGGSPDGAKLLVSANTDLNRYIELAKNLIDIKEDIKIEEKKKK